MENNQISYAEEFQIIYVITLSSRKWSITSYFLREVVHSDFIEYERGKENFTVEKPDKHQLR